MEQHIYKGHRSTWLGILSQKSKPEAKYEGFLALDEEEA